MNPNEQFVPKWAAVTRGPLNWRTSSDTMISYREPFVLSTEERVEWANDRLDPDERTEPWKLGDTCWYGKKEWRDG